MLTTGPLKENEKTDKKGTSYPRRRREVEKLLIGTKSAKIFDNRRKGKGSRGRSDHRLNSTPKDLPNHPPPLEHVL